MAQIEVILREKLPNYGAEADIVKVRRGFARNFLLPQQKAFEATEANKRHVKGLQAKRAAREAEELANAQALANKIKKAKLTFKLSTGQGGKAFGSITSANIVDALKEQANLEIDRHALVLDKGIKTTGAHTIEIKLHPEIKSVLKINVEAEAVPGADDEEEKKSATDKS